MRRTRRTLAGTAFSFAAIALLLLATAAVTPPARAALATGAAAALTTKPAATTAPLRDALGAQAPRLKPEVLGLALDALTCATSSGAVQRPELLTVIDYSVASREPRLWVFDLAERRLLFEERVAHGRNSGGDLPTRFSNTPGSRQSSLGLFVTADTYVGRNGYSLRLDGLEPGVNDRARQRAIVMHGAPYASEATARALGRLGRSWGCPAVRTEIARELIDTIKDGSAVFSYYPSAPWLESSRFLRSCTAR
jgi:hypothetical protein